MNKMQLLEYVLMRLYVSGTSPYEAHFILQVKMGYTSKDMDQVEKEIVSKEWPDSHTPEEALTYSNKRILEYEMQ